ncbi:MAG TPA: OmpA family protein [Geminicoccaceae bacterium]|nr:OmpA family protein [Geminicoccaceae bacterium]
MLRLLTAVSLLSLIAPAVVHAQQPDRAATAQARTGQYMVFFAFDSATLDAEARSTIGAAAAEYQRTGAARVLVQGHADTSGSPSYNQALSERRADAVAAELVRQGVPDSEISRSGAGENELLVPTGEGVREPRNRRVEIQIGPTPAGDAAPMASAAPAPAAARREPAPAPGAEPRRALFSVGLLYGFNLSDDDSGDKTSHLAGANLGFDYRLTDWASLSLEQAGFYNFFAEDEGFGGRSAAGLDFTLGLGNVIPYVGGNFGYIYGSGIEDDFFAGPEIGLNLGPVTAKVAYDMPFNRSLDEGIIFTTIGLGLQF